MVLIKGKRIRILEKHLPARLADQPIVVALTDIGQYTQALSRLGFSTDLTLGEKLLPAKIGPISKFNAEGGNIVHRDREMETAFRIVRWTWVEFHGRDNRIEKTDYKSVPYQRYPRTRIAPPSIEVAIYEANGSKIVATEPIINNRANENRILHIINLFLEAFGECVILNADYQQINIPRVIRLNWEVLPQGRMVWDQLKERLNPTINRASIGNKPVVAYRFETISTHGSDFCAIGKNGFEGYVIFGFQGRNMYVLESRFTGNATYIFGENWEHLSQLTKADILDNNLHQHRLIHNNDWYTNINQVLQ